MPGMEVIWCGGKSSSSVGLLVVRVKGSISEDCLQFISSSKAISAKVI